MLAEAGSTVRLVDPDAKRIESLHNAQAPFFEPGVNEALSRLNRGGRLETATRLDAVAPSDFVFLCVGTPARRDGSADLKYLASAAADVARALPDWPRPPTVVIKSTVPPGTHRTLVRPALEAGGRLGRDFGLASNPEFLREGNALADARAPDRIVVGTADTLSARALRRLYRSYRCPYLETDPDTAEAIKYVSNAFLATKVGFSNEIANLCRRLGIDVYDVMDGVGLDARIGRQFLRAGVGFGGSCFPKDVAALRAVAQAQGVRLDILDAVAENNERQPLEAIEIAKESVGRLQGKRVALLGLAFKPDTSDVRETRALPIYRALVAEGADVVCYDPIAGDEFRALAGEGVRIAKSLQEALEGRDVAIVQTEWPEFRKLKAKEIKTRMRTAVVIDGRRALDGPALRRGGVDYRAIGLGQNRGATR